VLTTNPDAQNASLLDMFRTEEIGNTGRLDLTKIQMFYFTVLIVLTYAAALREILMLTGPITDFPVPSSSIVGLLGLSHAAYLASKAIGGSTNTEPS